LRTEQNGLQAVGDLDSSGRSSTPPPKSRRLLPVDVRPWVFPGVVICLTLILTLTGWSGTSLGVVDPSHSQLIAGTPRAIRSDEWNVATPLIVAQSHHGYPATTQDSVGAHSLNVLLDVPTKTWPSLFRPWDYGFFFLGLTRGFAFRWWTLSAVLLLGGYALLLQLTKRVLPAALFSVALWASPFFHWWYLDISLASAGLGMLALAAFLAALEQRRGWIRLGLLAATTWALVAFVLVLYPPFQIPVAITMAAIGIADVWATRGPFRRALREVGPPLGAVLVSSLALAGAYYFSNRTAINLINSTVYPGHRRDTGGNTSLYQFFSAPYGVQLALRGTSLSFTNQSEISSFIFVAPYVLLQVIRTGIGALPRRARMQLVGAIIALSILSIWFFLGLPLPLAMLTGLDRVPGQRSLIGIGMAGLFTVAIFSTGLRSRQSRTGAESPRHRLQSRRLGSGALLAAGVAFGVTFWSGKVLEAADPSLKIGSHSAFAISLGVALATFLLSLGRPVAGASALSLLGLIVVLPVNPLYSGLSPYTSPEVTAVFTSVPDANRYSWVSFSNVPVANELIASGLRTVNAVSPYPNPAAWKVLDPSGSQRFIWDRYANLTFIPSPGLSTARLALPVGDQVEIEIDPCSPELRQLGVRFIVAPNPLGSSCLTALKQAEVLGANVYLYETQ
jgi:hypothetical protein